MPDLRDFLEPSTVAQLDRLEIVARRVVEGFLRGPHRSPAKGSSIEFAEHRPYVPGDEIRHLDWRTYARTDRFYLRQYEDETNLRAFLVVDTSASMGFGSGAVSKLRYAACLAAAFGYVLQQQGDAVGLILADSDLREFIPPRTTAENLAGIFSAMERMAAGGRTALGPVLSRVAERIPARSMVLVFSDLLDDPQDVLRGLAHLRQRQCEVLAFHVLDPAEVEFPFSTWVVFRDPEDPGVEIRLDARQARELYLENLAEHREVLRKGCVAAEIDLVGVDTQEPFELCLARYVHLRSGRR